MSRKWVVFLLVSPTLLGFDLWSKAEVVKRIPLGEEVPLIGGLFSLFHAENPYVAFSMPVPQAVIFLGGIVALGLLLHMVWSLPRSHGLEAASAGMILAGAAGNLIDRAQDGTVTDMFMLYTEHPTWAPWLVERFGTATWPIFNIADMAIIGGVLLFFAWQLLGPEEEDDPLLT